MKEITNALQIGSDGQPVGNFLINSSANDGPDNTINGWRGFPNACGII